MLLCTSSSSFVKPVHLLPLWVEILASYKLTAASVWKLPLVKRSCLTQEKPVLSNWPTVKCNAWPFAWVENNSKVLAVHQRHCGTGWGCCSEWFIVPLLCWPILLPHKYCSWEYSPKICPTFNSSLSQSLCLWNLTLE